MNAEGSKRLSISSIVGLILGIIGVLLSAVPIINNFAFVLAILALIFGIVGLVRTKNEKKKGRGLAIAAIVLAVIAFIVVLASQKIYSDALTQTSNEINDSLDKSTGKKTDEILGKEVNVDLGEFEATQGEFMTETKLPVKVTNKNSEAKSYSIQIEAVDDSGSRIAEETVYANSLAPNQSQDFKAFEFVQSDKVEALKAAEFKIVSVSQY
jgi:hypothetical protein